MTTAAEAAAAKGQLAADLAAGVLALSLDQTISFKQYARWMNPIDGFVFWLLSPGPVIIKAQGSLHYSTQTNQNEDETAGVNQVIFTSLTQVNDLNAVAPTTPTGFAYATGDQTANITVTTSASLLTGTPEAMVNGTLTQTVLQWIANALTPAEYIQFDFGTPTYVNAATYYQSTTAVQGTWQWQASLDADNWDNIGDTFTLGGATTNVMAQLAGNVNAYRYYRLRAISGTPSATPYFEQIQFSIGALAPDYLYIGAIDGLEFAFNSRGSYYQQADLHHYVGTAVYPALKSQIIDDVAHFDKTSAVVSNSLPIWLALNSYAPPYPGFVSPIALYSSFVVPDNLVPPYGVVHIQPDATKVIASAPYLDRTLGHYQLSRDTVRITMYGANNDAIMNFVDFVNQYSYDTSDIGFSNAPTVQDEKRTQSEMTVLAMKKTIEFEVSYLQSSARNIARQLITESIQTYLPQPLVAGNVAIQITNA